MGEAGTETVVPVEPSEVTDGLLFPEGPVVMPDGSVVLVEMFAERLSRVAADGTTTQVAEVEGAPNGLALGPDGAIYMCNNGRAFGRVHHEGMWFPGPFDPSAYIGGRIQRVDPATGAVSDLYTECDGRPLRAPNDLVMDAHGGFYFTDFGIRDVPARTTDLTAIYYARCDGSHIREVVYPVMSPNGIGLSPDGTTLYWGETFTGHVYARRITEPGVVAPDPDPFMPGLLYSLRGKGLCDSLAVDAEGWVCVATLIDGAITAIAPDASRVERSPMPDVMTTNIAFGGADLGTAYVTLSSTGKLVTLPWPRSGLRLNHQ